MRIGGWQKTTLLDFPGRVASLVFTQGCNFSCPYCHNPNLVRFGRDGKANGNAVAAEVVLRYLEKRRHLLQGVAISGGEPALQPDLPEFIRSIRAFGLDVKIDTNGSSPQVLESLVGGRIVDYVAMDVKSIPGAYPPELCSPGYNDAVLRSLEILRTGGVKYELRITCVAPFVSEANFATLLAALPRGVPIFLQQARLDGEVLDSDYIRERAKALPCVTLEKLAAVAVTAGYDCRRR